MTTKHEWLERLAFKREELLASLDGLSEAGWAREMLPGWTAQDVLAHLAAWETCVATHVPDLLAGQGQRIVCVEVDADNAEQVAARRHRTPRELLDELAASRARLVAALANATDQDLSIPRAVQWGQTSIERWALQDICDHDAEHAAQFRLWRAENPQVGRSLLDTRLDDMAAERASLFIACLGLEAQTLSTAPVMDEWTVKDLLAHVAVWDDAHTQRCELALAGRESEIESVDLDERNAVFYAERRDWPLERALQEALAARRRYAAVLSAASEAQMARPLRLGWRETSIWQYARWRARHDAAHARQIRAWRDGETRRIAGEWTLKDVCGHMADWDLFALQAIEAMREARTLPVVPESDVAKFNSQHAAARRGQSWDQVWAEFQHRRAELYCIVSEWDDEWLAQSLDCAAEWGRTPYGWIVGQTIWHDREHADALRA